MSEKKLELINISKSYPDGQDTRLILDDLSLSVAGGEFVAIVGPSGSGKSTLLSIAGLLLSPDSGKILISGNEIFVRSVRERTLLRINHIGFIFQSHQLLPYLKTVDQLNLVRGKKANSDIKAEELLSELGIEGCANKYPSKMSGGEKQRVAIARAFINDPEIILADEPTASLDASRGRSVAEMIRDAVKKRNKASVMVTHDTRILDLADTVYKLEGGKLVL